MATQEQEDQLRKDLITQLNKIKSINVDDLIRTEELGAVLSFSQGKPYFERVLNLFDTLADSNLENLSYTAMVPIVSRAKEVLGQVEVVKKFSPNTDNPANHRDALINWFINVFDSCFTEITPLISYSIRKGTDFDRLEREARGALEQLKDVSKEAQEAIIKSQKDADETLEKIRQTAAQTGVAHHAENFKKEFTEHNKTAVKWLIATSILGFITALWGYFGFQFEYPNDDQAKIFFIIRAFASRITVFSVLIFMCIWSGKNYAAHRHNVVINRHRHNALITFETFVKAAGNDADIKNAVLLQATQSIFCSQQTGYINKESDLDQPNKVIEIIRGVGNAVSKS